MARLTYDLGPLDDLMKNMMYIKMQDWLGQRSSQRSAENMAKMMGGYHNLAAFQAMLEEGRAGKAQTRLEERDKSLLFDEIAKILPRYQRLTAILNAGKRYPELYGMYGYGGPEEIDKELTEIAANLATEIKRQGEGGGYTEKGVQTQLRDWDPTSTRESLQRGGAYLEGAKQRASTEKVALINKSLKQGEMTEFQDFLIEEMRRLQNELMQISRMRSQGLDTITDPEAEKELTSLIEGASGKRIHGAKADEIASNLEALILKVGYGQQLKPEEAEYIVRARNISEMAKKAGYQVGGEGDAQNLPEEVRESLRQQVQKYIETYGKEPSPEELQSMYLNTLSIYFEKTGQQQQPEQKTPQDILAEHKAGFESLPFFQGKPFSLARKK